MIEWTIELVAERFVEAVDTSRRLPAVRIQSYFNVWPDIVRQEWERFAADERKVNSLAPPPDAVERMLETMQWVQWLELEQRRLVWMRAQHNEWEYIGKQFACCRTTVWRRWKSILQFIVVKLNAVHC